MAMGLTRMATPRSSPALALLCSFLLLAGAAAPAAAAGRLDVEDMLMMDRFRAWQARLDRTYATAEERLRRFEIYRANMAIADETNRRGLSYRLGETAFADLTHEEFRARFTTPDLGERLARAHAEARQLISTRAGPVDGEGWYYDDSDDDVAGELPTSVDWRTKGAVTPVKNQSDCGCCWAFCTVASIEGLHKIKTGNLVSLSEQELVDCDVGGHEHGCNGGVPYFAMKWVAKNGGLTTESDYPYKNAVGKCDRNKAAKHAVKIAGGRIVSPMNEDGLMRAVARQPVAVGINATLLHLYTGGLYTGPCDSNIDHGVTVVGYGTGATGKYWIIKNSWGEDWGEKGYFLLPRGVAGEEGMCGIATAAVYPVM